MSEPPRPAPLVRSPSFDPSGRPEGAHPRSPSGAPDVDAEIARLELVAEWMDKRYLDPLLGLFLPGVGDTLGSLVGVYGVFTAVRLGLPSVVVARMLLNLAIDALVGAVPFLGVVFDLFFRAHTRNLELLKSRAYERRARGGDYFVVGSAIFLFVIALLLPIVLFGLLIAYLVRWLS